MLKVGAYLRTQRERKGLSYEQIHEITRISPDVLRKIEAGQSLSAPIFLKGFVKNYAQALGLDPHPLLKELEEREEEPPEFEEKETEESVEQMPSSGNRRKWFYFLFVFCCVVLGLLTVLPHFSKFKSLSENSQEEENQALSPKPAPVEEKEEDKSPTFSLLEALERDEFSQEVMINPQEPLEVYFKADGGSIIAKSLLPENWYVIKAFEKIYLRIDEPVSFSMIHNGEWKKSFAPLEQTFE